MRDMNADHEDALTALKNTYNQQIIQLQEEIEAQKRSRVKYARIWFDLNSYLYYIYIYIYINRLNSQGLLYSCVGLGLYIEDLMQGYILD